MPGKEATSVSGFLAAACASLGLGGFLLTPWLAFLPAVAALGLFTLVIWCAAWGLTARSPALWQRLLLAPVAALIGSAAFWRAGELPAAWAFAVPFLVTAGALAAERRTSWAVAAVASLGYAALFWL